MERSGGAALSLEGEDNEHRNAWSALNTQKHGLSCRSHSSG